MAAAHPRHPARAIIRLPWVKTPQAKTVFVLGGGGNLGAIQVGMLRAVVERGIAPDEIVGCSVGAINASALASDPTVEGIHRLQELWLTVPDTAMAATRFEALRLLTRGTALQPNSGLRMLIEEMLEHRRFEEFPVPFHVVATSMRTGHERWFSEGDVVGPILASAALPGVFPPVTINGETFIDGGVVNNVPISKAYDLRATRVVVFHVGNFERARPEPKRPIDVMIQAFSIARGHRFHLDLTSSAPDGVELLVLPGVNPGKLRYNDFSRSTELIERGYEATAAHLDTVDLAIAR
ncbi:MAG TPA: patatin-like phospholipase family protein [Acidimicrobiales bacterium]|jgi:NTE family protein|nr:patatin-like phospholipase family protein [Acidimicrobiales bacterium]